MIKIENKRNILFEKIEALIKNDKLSGKKIVLFGLNTSSYATKNYLEANGYKIYAYIDNDDKKLIDTNNMINDTLAHHLTPYCKQNIEKELIYAYKPQELLGDFDNNVIILIASKYYPSMCEQLRKMGYIENEHIIRTVDFYDIDNMIVDDSIFSNMEMLDDDEIRKIQMDIVDYLQSICRNNNLKCYMTGGTLLGAVRHGGYIPWDDDIDITIPMPDYMKLINVLLDDDKYDILTMQTHPDTCPNFYMRIVDKQTIAKSWGFPYLTTFGVSIDVFPLIGLPDSMDKINTFFYRIRNLLSKFTSLAIEYDCNETQVREQRAKLSNEIMQMTQQYDFYQSEYAGYILSKYWEKDIMPRSIYDVQIEMKFEDRVFIAPGGYADYLERIFGDYMKLPPEKERYVTHSYRAYKKL